MLWYGRTLLHDNIVDSFEAQQARYDGVTLDDIMEVLEQTFTSSNRSVAVVGDVNEALPV